MSSGLTIRADGLEWPLETYLDARGFIRVDPFAPPSLGGGYMSDPRVEIVTLAGELQPERYASSVMWADVLAFRLVDHTGEPCFWCGTSTDDADMCDDCAEDCW